MLTIAGGILLALGIIIFWPLIWRLAVGAVCLGLILIVAAIVAA